MSYHQSDVPDELEMYSVINHVSNSMKSSKKTKSAKQPTSQSKTAATSVKSLNLTPTYLSALTANQQVMMDAFRSGKQVAAIGSAGSGKTAVATSLAMEMLFNQDVERIIFVRSAVPTRDMGFMPGTLAEKTEVFNIPYKQIINELCGNGTAWDILTKNKREFVQFITTSYVRGITLNNAVVIIDEAQSMNFHELDSVITRCGNNTRLIVCADFKQNDLFNSKKEQSGLGDFVRVAEEMGDFLHIVRFGHNDIVRGEFMKNWIITKEKLGL